MKQFRPRALTKNISKLISAKIVFFFLFFNYASFAFGE